MAGERTVRFSPALVGLKCDGIGIVCGPVKVTALSQLVCQTYVFQIDYIPDHLAAGFQCLPYQQFIGMQTNRVSSPRMAYLPAPLFIWVQNQ